MIAGLDGFDVRKIDDLEYTVEISCYFLTKWRDDRLILHEDIVKVGERAEATEAYNGTTVEETWFPIDLEFVSRVSFKMIVDLPLKVFLKKERGKCTHKRKLTFCDNLQQKLCHKCH